MESRNESIELQDQGQGVHELDRIDVQNQGSEFGQTDNHKEDDKAPQPTKRLTCLVRTYNLYR